MGIFISRLLPVVRHLIGIPAGIVRMDFRLYSLFTLLGSGIWCARLKKHKTAKKKVRRVLLFGPKAQAILRPFLEGRDPGAYLFSPAEAMALRAQLRRKARKSKVQPSQRSRRKARPQRTPADHYGRCALERSVKYACKKAGVQPWHPYQLRHAAATRVVEEFDLDTARIILGHTKEEMTRRYAVDDLRGAAEAQHKAG